MINMANKKGYALMMALAFILLAAITSVGIYAYSGHIMRDIGIKKKSSTKSYYHSVSGARYAQILLKDPVANFGFSTEAFDGESKSVTITNAAGTVGADIGLAAGDTLTVTATEYNTATPASTPWDANSYQIETSYKH
jgi:hypothetical protein